MNSLNKRKGRLETCNNLSKAKPGDFLVTNTRTNFNESYIVPKEHFHNNYTFTQTIPEHLSNYSRVSIWSPVGKVRNAIHIKGENMTLLQEFIFTMCDSSLLNQEQLEKFMYTPVCRSNVKKDAPVLAIPLSQHLIDVFKSLGGLKTFVTETSSEPICTIVAPWGGTQPIYELDWILIADDGYYIVAKNEFDLTYSII